MDEIIEAAKAAVRAASGCGLTRDGALVFCDHCDCEDVARAAIAAIMPAIGGRMAGRALHQAEVNAKAREDRADDELAFEFRGIGNVIADDLRALASAMAVEVGR